MSIFNYSITFFLSAQQVARLEHTQERGQDQGQATDFSTPTLSNKKTSLEAYYDYLRANEGLSALWNFLEKNPAALQFLLKDPSLSPTEKVDVLSGLSKEYLASVQQENIAENLLTLVDQAILKKDKNYEQAYYPAAAAG